MSASPEGRALGVVMGRGMWHDVVKPIEVAKCEACGFSVWFSGVGGSVSYWLTVHSYVLEIYIYIYITQYT